MSKKKVLSDKQIEDMGLRVFVIKQHIGDILEISESGVNAHCQLYRDMRKLERNTQALYRSIELEAIRKRWSEDRLLKVFARRVV